MKVIFLKGLNVYPLFEYFAQCLSSLWSVRVKIAIKEMVKTIKRKERRRRRSKENQK